MSQAPTKSLPMNLCPICEENSLQIFRFLESELYHIHLEAYRLRLPVSSTSEGYTLIHVPLLPTYSTSSKFTLFPGSAEPALLPPRAWGQRGCMPILWSTHQSLGKTSSLWELWKWIPMPLLSLVGHNSHQRTHDIICQTITLASEPLNLHHNHRHADVSLCN